MKTIAGREVCETLEELVEPRATALVLVDLQNDFVAAGGVVDRRGERPDGPTRRLLADTAAVLERARAVAAAVVHVRYARTADHRYESPATLRWMAGKRGYLGDAVSAVEGTWGAGIVDALTPRPEERVIDKRRSSGFFGTALDTILREKGIRTVVIAGVSTHGCVESTARDAELRDYYVVLLEDCTAAYDVRLHEAALTVMRSRYEVVPARAVLEAWAHAEHMTSVSQ